MRLCWFQEVNCSLADPGIMRLGVLGEGKGWEKGWEGDKEREGWWAQPGFIVVPVLR
jgi:hypothetical protein